MAEEVDFCFSQALKDLFSCGLRLGVPGTDLAKQIHRHRPLPAGKVSSRTAICLLWALGLPSHKSRPSNTPRCLKKE